MASKLTWLVLALLIAAMQVHIANSRQLGGSSSGSLILSNPEVRNPNRDEKKVVAELLISRIAAESQPERRVTMPLEDDSGSKLEATRPTKRVLIGKIPINQPYSPPSGNPINSP
jgi:hypothetical protein